MLGERGRWSGITSNELRVASHRHLCFRLLKNTAWTVHGIWNNLVMKNLKFHPNWNFSRFVSL